MFCVKCGVEGQETIDGLCINCFLEGKKLITTPHHIDLMKCFNCEEYEIKDRWVKCTEDEAITNVALRTLQTIPEAKVISVGTMIERQEEKTFVVHIQADLDIMGFKAKDEDQIIVRLKNTVCKRCSRQLGSYYEAIMQIRNNEKTLSDDLRDEVVRWITATVESMAKTNRQLFITKVETVNGGVDLYLSSISLGKTLTRDLIDIYGAESKESASLVGMNGGSEVYRVTFLIRLPLYHTGDIIQFKDHYYELTALSKVGGRMTDLMTFRETTIKKVELQDVKVVMKKGEIRQAIVVSRSGGEMQVMHPSTYATVDIKVPEDAKTGETVPVVDFDDQLLYVP